MTTPAAADQATAHRPDAQSFAATAERITNHGTADELLALFADDATADWIIDGAHDQHRGTAAIATAAADLFEIGHALKLHVTKTVECADENTIVLSWTGGFGNGHPNGKPGRQFGTEIWTFRDQLVIRQQMYTYLDVRPSTSPLAGARLLLTGPAVVRETVKQRVRAFRAQR